MLSSSIMLSIVSIRAPARGATWQSSRRLPVSAGFNPRARAGRDQRKGCQVPATMRFNPRARAGRDRGRNPSSSAAQVSIRAPARGATRVVYAFASHLKFQSARPRGARHDRRAGCRPYGVSIRAPARGATMAKPQLVNLIREFQSARPRGARRSDLLVAPPSQVSIRAPARGATDVNGTTEGVAVFQSARPRGARPTAPTVAVPLVCFNPRARAGRDAQHRRIRETMNVSIRAPARGATAKMSFRGTHSTFQSARPRGARPHFSTSLTLPAGFNPRARAGRDRPHGRRRTRDRFQSARPRGARRAQILVSSNLLWFQSARPRGARQDRRRSRPAVDRFNPRARAGRDSAFPGAWLVVFCFNPRARAGRDLGADRLRRVKDVSIRAPARGATVVRGSSRSGSLVSIRAPARGATSCRTDAAAGATFQSARPRGARRRL